MHIPLVSVIIPCYNSGKYLPEAIHSVEQYSDKDIYEIIITNDGSTDEFTIQLLDDLENKGYKVLHQDNKGPASARNAAVKASKGEYLLFLDSDNKIRDIFIDNALDVFKKSENIGVVYGNANFFGIDLDKTIRFENGEFNLARMLNGNYIDMCSMIRRKTWEEIGQLDEHTSIIGHEDWDYWIRVGISKWNFFHINKCLFDYRLRPDSLVKQALQIEKAKKMELYIYSKYLDLFIENYRFLYHETSVYEVDKQLPFRSFFKYAYNKYLKRK